MTLEGTWEGEPHLLSHLTVKRGPSAGASILYCTCGWKCLTPNLDETKRLGDQHVALCGARWARVIT